MTFEARELSDELGAPILLASFFLGTKVWRFARADQDVVHLGNTYTGAPIDETRLVQSNDINRGNVTITVPRTFPIAELWRVSPPTGTVAVILTEVHGGDVDDEGSAAWLGHVGNVAWLDGANAEIVMMPGIVALKGTGLRRLWQRSCPHVLYGPECKVDRELYRQPLTLTFNDKLTLRAPEFALVADGKYSGGFIEWTDADGITDWRFITSHVGDTVTLMTPAPTLVVADAPAVDGFVGCTRLIDRCAEFENTDNYGGIPYFQGKNPFNGEPVY